MGKKTFRREIITVLLVKLVLIYGLWLVFFSSPIDETLTSDVINSKLFGGNSNVNIRDLAHD